MFTLKAYRNYIDYDSTANDYVDIEKLTLEVKDIVGHAFGTLTFSLQRIDGSVVIYKYENYDRIELTPDPIPEEELTEDGPVEGELVN